MSEKKEEYRERYYKNEMDILRRICAPNDCVERLEAYVAELEAENERLELMRLREVEKTVLAEREVAKLRAKIEGSPKVWLRVANDGYNGSYVAVSEIEPSLESEWRDHEAWEAVYAVPVDEKEAE